jgi:hypothetical protein
VDDFLPQTTRSAETKHGHEANKLSVRRLVMFASALVALGIAVELLIGGVMNGLSEEFKNLHAVAQPPFTDDSGAYPAPRLQDDPAGEFATFKEKELDRLNGYGWVDQPKGFAHIPIDRAIDILAARGLPKGAASGEAGTTGEPRRAAGTGDRKP